MLIPLHQTQPHRKLKFRTCAKSRANTFIFTEKLFTKARWLILMGVRRKFSRGGNVDILLILFRLLTMQCKWTFKKRFSFSTPQRKLPMIQKQSQKMRFVGSDSQVCCDNLHYGAQPFRYCRPHYVYFYEVRPTQIVSTSLFDCLSTKHARRVDQGSQTRRPHVVPEGILCDPRRVLGTFIQPKFKLFNLFTGV